jgi:alpha-amylase
MCKIYTLSDSYHQLLSSIAGGIFLTIFLTLKSLLMFLNQKLRTFAVRTASVFCKPMLIALTVLLVFSPYNSHAQATRVKKVLFQGFWWNFANNNFSNKWSNYLTELTPRLKAIGIDAVWVPPSYKNGSTGSVGYSPFDHYDLGDKYQKGGSGGLNVRTRMGNKDELLRLFAVLHANGIEGIQDIVLNHVDGAGNNTTGAGGQDPQSPYSIANASGYKNFRYTSYATPLVDDSQNDYWTRGGRWSKNYPNFYPNLNNNCTTGDICSPFFGPDISYEASAYGQSSNIPTTGSATIGTVTRPYNNPGQASNHMRDNARNWIMWYKKQTGADGWRWDAVKHFPIYVQEDLTYNTKYVISSFAQGGEAMMNIGEWIGTKTELDNYVTNVRSGTEEHTGTFDFNLRGYGANGGLYSMVLNTGAYNMQNLPGEQQDKRYYNYASQRVHRTCPFVNSHDTYRPLVDANGNFLKPLGDATGWDTGQELGGNGQHIDPREPRLFSAYATVFAMDGNPVVFFEDLFDIGTTSKRFSHLPTSATDLPVRNDIVNIIQAHQRLEYKKGDYGVPTALTGAQAPFYAKGSSGDHIVFERTGRALIGVTDKYNTAANNTQDEEVWVNAADVSWRNVDLIDYSGAHGVTVSRVQADGRVLIKTAPVGHTIAGARGHGYSIWAPKPAGVTINTVTDIYNYLANLSTTASQRATQTVQEWEMADDLGDSHPSSLRQGGKLPTNSTAQRTAGRIYAASGKTITYKVFPEVNGLSQNIALYNTSGTLLSQVTGASSNTAPLTGSYTPSADGWLTIKVKNTTATQAGQKVWVNVTYTAPVTVNTRTGAGSLRTTGGAETDESIIETEDVVKKSFKVYPNPSGGNIVVAAAGFDKGEAVSVKIVSADGTVMMSYSGSMETAQPALSNRFRQLKQGVYLVQVNAASFNEQLKLVKVK